MCYKLGHIKTYSGYPADPYEKVGLKYVATSATQNPKSNIIFRSYFTKIFLMWCSVCICIFVILNNFNLMQGSHYIYTVIGNCCTLV